MEAAKGLAAHRQAASSIRWHKVPVHPAPTCWLSSADSMEEQQVTPTMGTVFSSFLRCRSAPAQSRKCSMHGSCMSGLLGCLSSNIGAPLRV